MGIQELTILRHRQHWTRDTEQRQTKQKNHNTENYRDEQHGPHHKTQTQKTTEMSNMDPTIKHKHRKLQR